MVSSNVETRPVALQISQNLLQYFFADSRIVEFENIRPDYSQEVGDGNVITLALGGGVPESELESYPIALSDNSVVVKHTLLNLTRQYDLEEGMGAIFLRPLPQERLELVVWGFDQIGLHQAARLIPTLTGGGQPDFVILSKSCLYKGYAGVLAMGFLDHSWQVSRASYLT